MRPAKLLTLAGPVEADGEKIKGARFVGRAAPFDMNRAGEEATSLVEDARGRHADAVHHGWAYRAGPEHADFRWSDDGEPVGSAGASILRRIDALALLNVVVVVSRWGGAQRLGAGDLAKGYADAARAALAAADVIAFVPTSVVAVTFAYALSGPVQGVLASFRAEHEGAEYGERTRLVVRVASDRIEALRAAVLDATAGQAGVELV